MFGGDTPPKPHLQEMLRADVSLNSLKYLPM